MPRPTTAARRRPAGRRGAILLVVLALLAIFAVIGIAFVFYSDGEMNAARYHRESQTANGQSRPTPPNFDAAAEDALGKLIFGDYANQLNGFRGHDLMTAMYGGLSPTATTTTTDPYTGQGIFHEKLNPPFDTLTSRGHVVSYTPLAVGDDGAGNPAYFVFDPEVTGPPRQPAAVGGPLPSPPTDQSKVTTGTYVSKAAPYTYPDLNNFYLASIIPGTGETVLPSFYRPWHFNRNNPNVAFKLAAWNPSDTAAGTNTAANTDWVTAEGRTRTVRPRPIDQLTGPEIGAVTGKNRVPTEAEFAALPLAKKGQLFNVIDAKIRAGEVIGYPRPNQDNGTTGDVFNLIGGVGVQRNDSILVDFGAQPFTWPPGSNNQVKPLAAVLITDLDGSLNLNAHGNVRNNGKHTSFHGLGPWEVNLASAFGNAADGDAVVAARYGSTAKAVARDGTATLAYAGAHPASAPFGRAPQFTAASLINWDATGTGGVLQIPSFSNSPKNHLNVTPNYAGTGYYDDNTGATQQANHPALYNPGDWGRFSELPLNPLPGTASSYAHADTRRLRQRYAGELDLYQQTTFFRIPPAPAAPVKSLIGDGAAFRPGVAPPAANAYRNDPAHGRRLLFTTLSADLDRPRMSGAPTGEIKLAIDTIHPTNAAFAGTLSGGEKTAVMPALDINRPLEDYRDLNDTTNTKLDPADPMMMKRLPDPKPLSAANKTNAAAAWADRHNLARDIFARLVLATGGKATVDTATGDVKIDATLGTTTDEFHALRSLAQLAVNVVDYIDTDDVSTAFAWRPAASASLASVDRNNVKTTVESAVTEGQGKTPPAVGDYVVFGVEMPRLVLNEVYAEMVNDAAGKGKGKGAGSDKDGRVRFWVEMVNPGTTPYAAGTGPLGDGSVTFLDGTIKPYKLAITRSKRMGATTEAGDYVRTDRANVTGGLPDMYPSDITYDFTDAGGTNTVVKVNKGTYDAKGDPKDGFVIVGPEATGANPPDEFDPTKGGAAPWDKMIQAKVGGAMSLSPMEYVILNPDLAGADPSQTGSEYRRHVVLLRRLANPYEIESAGNPYITVDVMDYVPANDAIYTNSGGGMAGGVPMAQRFSVGRVQPLAGQAKPDTAMAAGAPAYTFPSSFLLAQKTAGGANDPLHTFGRHNGATATEPTANTVTAGPPTTMTETLMAPFDWHVHLDRPLINELELLHVQAVKPHQVTQYTFQPPAAGKAATDAIRRNLGLAPWLGVTAASGDPAYDTATGYPTFDASGPEKNATGNGLYRALELLRGKSRVYGTATGGRVQGKVNINTVQDVRVLLALLDPSNGNGSVFSSSEVYNPSNPADPATIWGRYIGSRTRGLSHPTTNPRFLADGTTFVGTTTPGKTLDDDPFDPNWTTLDRPFKSFGVAEANLTAGYTGIIVGGGSKAAMNGMTPAPFGPGLQDTLLRVNTDATSKTLGLGVPLAYTTGSGATHPYLQAEALRKLLTNTTTVSNVFAVHVTIVYHNVRMSPPPTPTVLSEGIPGVGNRPLLGSEAFQEVPGDMRRQYFAVVDRSNAMIGSTSSSSPMTNPSFQAAAATDLVLTKGTPPPVMPSAKGTFKIAGAKLDKNNATLSVASDGQVFTLSASGAAGTVKTIYVGSGADRLSVDITDINVTTDPGLITVSESANTARTFPAGSVVSNGIPGRVSVPSPFKPFQEPGSFPYTQLVPYSGRLR